eukprot:GHVS01097015.1.p1 GENE.GHVS01097015.1~~GHVS01097015.1.p1  ORF type:complete len:292 (-),score=25.21 GHVS01097015.1:154-978(-)
MDAFSVAQTLYFLNVIQKTEYSKLLPDWIKFVDIMGGMSKAVVSTKGYFMTLVKLVGFSAIGRFNKAVTFGRDRQNQDDAQYLASTKLLLFCYLTSIPLREKRLTVKQAAPYLTLHMDELEEQLIVLENILWETSLIVSTMPQTLTAKGYFKMCAHDFWVDSLKCILEISSEVSKQMDANFNTGIVEWSIKRMVDLQNKSIFYQAYKEVGEEEEKYKAALGNAFAMELLYSLRPPQTEVVVSAGAKADLEKKLKDLNTLDDYDKLKLVQTKEEV